MKKLYLCLGLGIALLGTVMVYQQWQFTHAVAAAKPKSKLTPVKDKVVATKTVAKPIEQSQVTVSSYPAAQVDPARVWLAVKGHGILTTKTKLHIKQIAAGTHVKPDNVQSVMYTRAVVQVATGDLGDTRNVVTYADNHDGTVTLYGPIPYEWDLSVDGHHEYDRVVRADTQGMLEHQQIVAVPKGQDAAVLKLVELEA
ncbi:hypothetical protein [Lactiplantibacillus fabifermentans]|nr:hypothetical protein [Lactiplantibacillus fabifermentans]ETY75588.1 hypothetical protein LFAB_01180 [Lactiplantibacillus fabifermentans T30PCM01]